MRFPMLFIALSLVGASHADVRLSNLFSDHMVLQRDRPVAIWGWATPGEKVAVSLGARSMTAITDRSGYWRVNLGAFSLSTKPLTLRVSGKNQIVVNDVLMGDVWLCSGQSNMEMSLGGCNAPADIASADFPLIRQFGVDYKFASKPQSDVGGRWAVSDPQTSPGFSAVAFYFARKVHAETGVPIGIMRSCVGGTNIELWMSQETLMNTPILESYAKQMRDSLAQYQKDLAAILPAVEKWSADSKKAMKAKTPVPLPPDMPPFPFGEQGFRPRCVTLHNGMINPLKGLSFKGVLWYQGESNAGGPFECSQYNEKLAVMIRDWRSYFNDPNLPFYYVQLANWLAPTTDPAGGDGWSMFRDYQRQALKIPKTGMASAIDVGEEADIHPRNKFDVGERLARWALKNEYGKDVVVSGPLYKGLEVVDSEARVTFDHVGSGMMAGVKNGREIATDAGRAIQGFAIAGEDRRWFWAEAKVVGSQVICTHPNVAKPVAVRYAYSMNPIKANLYNKEGLPASPFRTDNW